MSNAATFLYLTSLLLAALMWYLYNCASGTWHSLNQTVSRNDDDDDDDDDDADDDDADDDDDDDADDDDQHLYSTFYQKIQSAAAYIITVSEKSSQSFRFT